MMWIALDAVTLALIVFSLVKGYKKGLVKTAFKIGIIIAAVVIANSFSPVLSDYVKTTEQYKEFTTSVKTSILSSIESKESDGTESFENTHESNAAFDYLSKIGLDIKSIEEGYRQSIEQGVENTKETLDRTVLTPVTEFLCNSICFVVVFVASVLLLYLLMFLIDLVFKLPLLKSANKVGGLLLGGVFGVLKVFVFCTIFQIVLPYIQTKSIGLVCGMENSTYIYKFFLDINPLKFLY